MMKAKSFLKIFLLQTCILAYLVNSLYAAGTPNPNPPTTPTRLIFIHHSTGENWLNDENGTLGLALRNNNYYTSDTNYGWGPNTIGDYTDIGHWWLWFRGSNSPSILNSLYNEDQQHASYSRLSNAPDGQNEIIMFKSCFPNSALSGNINDPVPAIDTNQLRGQDSGSEHMTLANAKGIYLDILKYFATRQDKLFVVITAPPLSDPTYSSNARSFNQWLYNDWLKDYPYHNVAVFDFYNVLTTNGGSANVNDLTYETGNHHRWYNNTVQHKIDGDDDGNPNIAEYPSEDDHPSMAGNLKATGEYLPILNIYYNCWKNTGGCPNTKTTPPLSLDVKVNNSDGPLTVSSTDSLNITVSLNAGSSLNVNADWWVAANTPSGWYYYVYPTTWRIATSIDSFLPAHQGPLFDLPQVQLPTTGLSIAPGTYTFYFAIDTAMNGYVDFDHLTADGVLVEVK
ncbi:MAG: hypothetical protein HQL06_01385 [Nitrospirae bacterium]|nr:hypothetical protein [Nitrospirota bacterium]